MHWTMFYGFLADGVVVLHFLWVLFLLFGAIWGRKNRKIRLIHVSGLVFATLLEIFQWYCPLTYLEVWLRDKQKPAHGYAGPFIAHYLEKLIYIQLPHWTVMVLTLLLVVLNGWVYLRKCKR